MKTVYQLADNLLTSLGFDTHQTVQAILQGTSGVSHIAAAEFGVGEDFWGSRVSNEQLAIHCEKFSVSTARFTRFEQMAIVSVAQCVSGTTIDLSSEKVLFILSTTKGNVTLLDENCNRAFAPEKLTLNYSAQQLAQFFSNPNKPLVVSNACISGVSAQIVAARLLRAGAYETIVVVGAEELSRFVVSGFQSFKALSPERCRPFDASRCGLNLGEGAATIIYSCVDDKASLEVGTVLLQDGAITNDANHISGPSRTGEGLYQALTRIRNDKEEMPGFISAHGTATPYNDEMESIALHRAGLDQVPVNSLKAYLGHTLGAAGLVETIISSASLKENKLIKSIGYETCGVSYPLPVITQTSEMPLQSFVKMVSGFGGCNAAIWLQKVK